jgi:ribonucleoside-diphosphate reductase alpha chain
MTHNCNVSRIRATGSQVMGNDNASGGVIPWIKLLNDTAIAVNQGGRRAGAITVSLDIWHLDVLEFLEMQTESGDPRRKAYDVFPQLVLNDVFNEAVEVKSDWLMVCPYEIKQHYDVDIASLWGEEFKLFYSQLKVDINTNQYPGRYKEVGAQDLFKSIMKTCVETGLPYLVQKDEINRANPNKHEGYIPGVNLCVESFSNVGTIDVIDEYGEISITKVAHTCNLISLNLANINTNSDELEKMCKLSVRALDNSIEVNTPSFEDSAIHNQRYRVIGVGTMGLADWMAKNNLKYSKVGSEGASRSMVSDLYERIAFYTAMESVELAKQRGAYPAYEGSEWSEGLLLGSKTVDELQTKAYGDAIKWNILQDAVKQCGIRNSQIVAIAPNTSSSLVQGCTASILPTYSRVFEEKWHKGQMLNSPPFIHERPLAYEENIHLDQSHIISLVKLIQTWVDTGISMELVFNNNENAYYKDGEYYRATPKHIYDILTSSFDGIKAVYYQRMVRKDDVEKLNNKNDCMVCAN